ncbi:MAG: lipoyl synthase [Acidobacteriota bacterium]
MVPPRSGYPPTPARLSPPRRLPKPPWLHIRLRTGPEYRAVTRMVDRLALQTVCQEARCPNIFECWSQRTATLMILGGVCTRRCGFCSVASGRPAPADPGEPRRVGEAVAQMGLRHAVITSVDRDDLPDGGAAHWAAVIQAVRHRNPHTRIEVLVPDFKGKTAALETVLAARPDVFAHNVETVPRLYKTVRPGSRYSQSLALLRRAAGWRHIPPRQAVSSLRIKSNLMLGLGETHEEILDTLQALRGHGVEIVTIGQYLQPTPDQLPVQRYVPPAEFRRLAEEGRAMGFWHVEAGPLVRSSYHAADHRPGGTS